MIPLLYVWNAQNRLPVIATVRDATDSWTYTEATWRESNGGAGAARIAFVAGLAEGALRARSLQHSSSDTANVTRRIGIGYDATNAFADGCLPGVASGPANNVAQMVAEYARPLEIGVHYVAELEHSVATGTTTWYGDAGSATTNQQGMTLALEM